MSIRKTLCTLVAAAVIGLSGCEKEKEEEEYIYGTVLEESGTIVDRQKLIERSDGALFGNDSISFGDPTYAIKFKADNDKIYFFQVIRYKERLEALNLAIEPGTRIKIPKVRFTHWEGLRGSVGSVKDYDLYVLTDQK